jgi:hypothetical protein
MDISTGMQNAGSQHDAPTKGRRKSKKDASDDSNKKRRCISSACVPCRKRKSKVCNERDPARVSPGDALHEMRALLYA